MHNLHMITLIELSAIECLYNDVIAKFIEKLNIYFKPK